MRQEAWIGQWGSVLLLHWLRFSLTGLLARVGWAVLLGTPGAELSKGEAQCLKEHMEELNSYKKGKAQEATES